MAEDCPVVRFSRDQSCARVENLKQNSHGEGADPLMCRTFDAFYIICIALSIITYVLDLVLASILLYIYYVHECGQYFALTLSFMVLPALFMTAFSLRWYIVDYDDPSLGKIPLCHWIIRIVFLLLQLSPLLRYIDTLIYGIKSKIAGSTENDTKQATLYRRMLDEDTNGALLRLFHCFLHAAPQAVIQLMILLTNLNATQHSNNKTPKFSIDIAVMQAWTVLAALTSIAWSLTSYHRSVRHSRDDKDKIKWLGLLMSFCWQLMSALSRVLALSLLASIFPVWMGCVCALHWGMMSIWLVLGHHQAAACNNRCDELLFSAALGLAYVMAFISPRDGPTRYVYLVYYLVCFMENTAALVVWCVTNNSNEKPFLYYGAAGGQVLAFLLAITFLMIYYKYCHPSLANRTKLPNSESDYLEADKPGYSKSTSYRVRTR